MMLTIILLVLILATALPQLEISKENCKGFWRRIISILLLCTLILTYESICTNSYYLFNGQLIINFKLTCLHFLVISTGLSLIIITYKQQDWTLSGDIFMISAITGSLLLSTANTSLTLLLGLELQSFSVYVLAASHKDFEPSESAGLKYFLLGAQSSALVFMGLALLYIVSGNLNLDNLFTLNVYPTVNTDIIRNVGIILIFIGFIWKIAAAPVHAWSVDVYDAVPSSTAAFLSLIPKIALISVILRMSGNVIQNYTEKAYFITMCTTIIILSLLVGAIIGLYQPRIKRLLAYSSILNMGFILMSILLTNYSSDISDVYNYTYNNYTVYTYLLQYIAVTTATWLCLIAIPHSSCSKVEIVTLVQLQGVRKSSYILAITLTILILSVAGIPPMIGFFAKYEVILLAVQTQHMVLAIFAIIASLTSTVYYLRIVRNIWFRSTSTTDNPYNFMLLSHGTKMSAHYTNIISAITFIVIGYSLLYSPIHTFICTYNLCN